MRKAKSVKALLLAASATSLGLGLATQAKGASYTWGGSGGAQTWDLTGNWTTPGFPNGAGDVANFNVALTGTLTTTTTATNITVGSLIIGDSNSLVKETLQFSAPNTLTMDNNGAGATISVAAGSDVENDITGMVLLNDNLTITASQGAGAKRLRIRQGNSGTPTGIVGGTHTITIGVRTGTGYVYLDNHSQAKLWVVNSKLNISGDNTNQTLTGDVIVNAGGSLQSLDTHEMGKASLVTLTGSTQWNMGSQDEDFGGLAGTGTINGGANIVAYGAASTPVADFSGTLSAYSFTVKGGTQKFSGSVATIAGPFAVTGGTLEMNKTVPTIGAGGLTVTGPGVALVDQTGQFAGNASISLLSGGKLKLATGSGITLLQSGISIDATSSIDVNTEKLILSGQSIASSTVVSLLKAGYAAGAWTGPGINTSAATPHKGLGYSVDGQDNTTVKFTLYGDTNLDGSINFSDLVTLAQHYNSTNATWSTGDSNYDNTVNFADLVALAQNYNGFQAGPTAGLSPSFVSDWNLAQAEVAAVPEPASVGLLAVGAVGLLARRRQRKATTA